MTNVLVNGSGYTDGNGSAVPDFLRIFLVQSPGDAIDPLTSLLAANPSGLNPSVTDPGVTINSWLENQISIDFDADALGYGGWYVARASVYDSSSEYVVQYEVSPPQAVTLPPAFPNIDTVSSPYGATLRIDGSAMNAAGYHFRVISDEAGNTFDRRYYDSNGADAGLNEPGTYLTSYPDHVIITDGTLGGHTISYIQSRQTANNGVYDEWYGSVLVPSAATGGAIVFSGVSNNPGEVTLSGMRLLADASGPTYLFRLATFGSGFAPDGFVDIFTGAPDNASNPAGVILSNWTDTEITIFYPGLAGETIDYILSYDATATVGNSNNMATPIVVQS